MLQSTDQSFSLRFVRLRFQENVYTQRIGLPSCAPTGLLPGAKPAPGSLLFLPSLKR